MTKDLLKMRMSVIDIESREIESEISIDKHGKLMKLDKKKKAMTESRVYLNQSIELLFQSIHISINNQFYVSHFNEYFNGIDLWIFAEYFLSCFGVID